MPKKHNSHRRLKGGFLDSLGQTFSNWGSSISQGASSAWEKTKNASSNMMTSTSPTPSTYTAPPSTPSTTTSYTPSTPSTYTPSTPTYSSNDGTYGGKKIRKGRRQSKRTRKVKRGGYRDNTSLTNLASNAAPFAGQTAKAHNWVGGKKRKTRGRGRR